MSDQNDELQSSGQDADSSFSEEPVGSPDKSCKPKTWIDFRLTDPNGKPIANMRFKMTDSEGRTSEGTTDSDGCAGVDGIDPGQGQITFLGPANTQ